MSWTTPETLLFAIIFLVLGLLGLYFGATLLVKGSRRLALMLGVKPLVIGMTVVALGTSAPEFVASVISAIPKAKEGGATIALGTILGSNIANIALIIGITALVSPIVVKPRIIPRELSFTVFITAAFWVMAAIGDGVSLIDGVILIVLYIGVTIVFVRTGRTEEDAPETAAEATIVLNREQVHPHRSPVRNIVYVVIGLGMLALGGTWLVESAIFITDSFGMPPVATGIVVVAVGTSLPELATCVVAQVRKQTDISIGNVLGSNAVNIVFVAGVTAVILGIVQPVAEGGVRITGIPVSTERLIWDFPIMMGFLLLFVVFIWLNNVKRFHSMDEATQAGQDTSGLDIAESKGKDGKVVKGVVVKSNEISRLEGGLLVIVYVLYLGLLVLFQGNPPWLGRPEPPPAVDEANPDAPYEGEGNVATPVNREGAPEDPGD